MLQNSQRSWLRMLHDEAPLYRLLKLRSYDDSVHIDTRSHDLVWIQLAQFNELFNFNNSKLGGGCHCRVEIPSRLPEDKISMAVGFPGLDQRDVRAQSAFHEVC